MKRVFTLILALSLCLCFAGCKSKEAKAAEELIAAIGTVSMESEGAITAAENAVAALTEKDLAKVENLAVLSDARRDYDVMSVEAVIDAIGKVDRNSKAAILAAEDALNALPAETRSLVSNAAAVDEANAAYKAIFVPVDITLDNWSEYLEFVTVDDWQEDAFGATVTLNQAAWVKLRDEVAQDVVMDSVDLRVGFTLQLSRHDFDVDWDSKVVTIGDLASDWDKANGRRFYVNTAEDRSSRNGTWSSISENWMEAPNDTYLGYADFVGYASIERGSLEANIVYGGTYDASGNPTSPGKAFIDVMDSVEVTRIEGRLTVIED